MVKCLAVVLRMHAPDLRFAEVGLSFLGARFTYATHSRLVAHTITRPPPSILLSTLTYSRHPVPSHVSQASAGVPPQRIVELSGRMQRARQSHQAFKLEMRELPRDEFPAYDLVRVEKR